jgi:hypothetical protein
VEQPLKSLESALLLDLRKGRKADVHITGENRPLQLIELKLVLDPIAGYKPADFNQRFAEISKALADPALFSN